MIKVRYWRNEGVTAIDEHAYESGKGELCNGGKNNWA